LHDIRHFTTAYDLALIARAFMDVPLLAEIVGMWNYVGDGLGGLDSAGRHVRNFNWVNTNQMLPNGPHGHPFVTGMRTGYTTPAGECLAASAYHNGLGLVSIVFDSLSPGRWNDTRVLLDYGFANYAFRAVATGAEITHRIELSNPRLEDDGMLTAVASGSYTALLSLEEFATLEREVTYHAMMLATPEDEEYDADFPRLRIPMGGINEGDVVGFVNYKINGEVVYTTNLYATHAVLERTFDSDMDFWMYRFFSTVFSRKAVPYWFGSVGTLFGIICLMIAITVSRRARNFGFFRPMKGRY
jgi:D-alanyl-D-alanine carboxypeptidase (penicillin-binding protein 5/6)